MKQIFVDTSAWMALLDGGDCHHQRALSYFDLVKHESLLISSNYVFDELYTLSLMNVGYAQSMKIHKILSNLQAGGSLSVVWVDENLGRKAWSVFEKYNVDKAWSFTDCVSFCVMKETDIKEVFTFDHHFTQMGFDQRPV